MSGQGLAATEPDGGKSFPAEGRVPPLDHYIVRFADLANQISRSILEVPFRHFERVLSNPHRVIFLMENFLHLAAACSHLLVFIILPHALAEV